MQDNDSVNESDSEDIEDALAKEVKQLQETKTEKRFQAVLTGAVNVIFIKTNLPDSNDPTDLVHTVLNDMLEKGCKKTRYGMACSIGSVFFLYRSGILNLTTFLLRFFVSLFSKSFPVIITFK